MTDKRDPQSGDNNDNAGGGAGDGLDAWLAANFPPPTSEPPELPPELPPTLRPPTHEPPPTVPLDDVAGEQTYLPPMAEELEGIPSAVEFPPSPAEAFTDVTGASGLDALFGESKFVEYEEGPSASENPFVRRPMDDRTPVDSGEGHAKTGKSPQVVLLWVAGVLLAGLALVALFVLGTKLPALLGPAPGALVAPTATPTPTPTATELPLGPVEPGEYLWNELLGGECINPYVGPWEIDYTVVDCELPHAAQLVTRGTFTPAETDGGTATGSIAAYPGVEALQSQVNLLCTAASVVDYGKANAYTDIQFEASYAITAQDWRDGNRSYYCFLSRSSGGELTGTIAIPPVAPAPSEPAAP